MPKAMAKEEIVRLGEELYDRDIRRLVEPGNEGRFAVVDVLTGNYQVADSVLAASDLARAQNPDAVLYVVRVGFPVVYRVGPLSRIGS